MLENNPIIAVRLIMGLVLFIIAIYLFICAIRVKGFVYINTPLHGSKHYPRYVKFVRIYCFALSGIFTVNFVLNVISFITCYRFEQAYLKGMSYDVLHKIDNQTRYLYNASTASLLTSIMAVAVMLFAIAIITSGLTSGVKEEALGNDHPAFKKENKDN